MESVPNRPFRSPQILLLSCRKRPHRYMKPVNFFEITLETSIRDSRETPEARRRLRNGDLAFQDINAEISASKSTIKLSTSPVIGKITDAPTLDEVFGNTIKKLLQKADQSSSSKSKSHAERNSLKEETTRIRAANLNRIKDSGALSIEHSEGIHRAGNSQSVMVVEDDSVIAGFLVHMLKRRGFDVWLAEDGRKAVKMLDELPAPKLVLLDIILPFIDGFEVIKRIRKKEGWEHVPIMLLTSKTQESEILRALNCGADDYIIKPFQTQELIDRVDRFMG